MTHYLFYLYEVFFFGGGREEVTCFKVVAAIVAKNQGTLWLREIMK